MTFAAADIRHISLEHLGRRPLLIAMLVYSLGFIVAGVILWRGVPARLAPMVAAHSAATDVDRAPLRAGDP